MTGAAKTGGGGGLWVDLEKPKPARVANHYDYWAEEPPEISLRCQYWLRQIDRGWRPNRHISCHCYDCSAEWYGVYIWEWLNLIYPKLSSLPGTGTVGG